MSPLLNSRSLAFALLAALAPTTQAAEFVYQGQLDDRGAPANGRYDLRIAAFGEAQSAQPLTAPITFRDVAVKDGRFELRFDAALANAPETWLEVAVRDAGARAFATVAGRSKAIRAPLIGACWSSTGDAGTNPATNFLGTSDAQPLVLRTANVQSLRIEPSAQTFGGSPITANLIAGSSANSVTAGVRGATIAGGGVPSGNSDPDLAGESPNAVADHFGTVGGGYANSAGDAAGTLADRAFATVGGGSANVASGASSTIGGGEHNTASGFYSAIAGGNQNFAWGHYSSVGGGYDNSANADFATVPGGDRNCAGGGASWAGGSRAKVRQSILAGGLGGCAGVPTNGLGGDEGTFLWADHQAADVVSTGPNQFLVRASGGIWLGTNSAPSIPAGRFLNTSTGGYLSSGGVWTDASSRTLKTGFAPVDAEGVLDRVLALPISEWSYRVAPQVRHLGPVAEDFHSAFGLGEGAMHVASLDSAGVALAAIQGLNARLESENAALRAELAALRTLVEQALAEDR